jgi:indoleamine 2,3-dioxygenase
MRSYIPRQHAIFLEQLCPNVIRDFVMSHSISHPITEHYNSAVAALASFRNKHIQIVTRYIILPSKAKSTHRNKVLEQTLVTKTVRKKPDTSGSTALLGTGGAVLVPFLKQARDETIASVIEESQ